VGDEQFRVADGVLPETLSVSAAGPIVFRRATGGGNQQLVSIDPESRATQIIGEPFPGDNPSLDPDGRQISVDIVVESSRRVWLWDPGSGRNPNPFTNQEDDNSNGVWSPDGQRLLVTRVTDTFPIRTGLYAMAVADPSDEIEVLAGDNLIVASDWADARGLDHQYVLFRHSTTGDSYDIRALPIDDDLVIAGDPIPVAISDAAERDGKFSPNGQWVAYQSDKSGVYQIYARSFPEIGPEIQISGQDGGTQVQWSPDGTALFYITPNGALAMVEVDPARATLNPGPPVELFESDLLAFPGNAYRQQYVVTPGGRILLNDAPDASNASIRMILNWDPEG
jgi:Tol biopolymer transport system component